MIPAFLVNQTLLGILVAAVVCGVAVLLFGRRLPRYAAAIGIALGFLAAFSFIAGTGSYTFPPRTIQHWLPYVAVAALALGALEHLWFERRLVRWAVRLALLLPFLWRVFQPFINHPFPSRSWTAAETAINLAGTTLIIALFWWGLDLLTSRRTEASRANAILPTGLMIVGAGSSLSVVLAHSLVMGQLSGALTATLGAVAVLAWLQPARGLPATVTPLVTLLLTLPWLGLYATLPVVTVVLLALAPWLLALLFARRPLLQQSLLRLGLTALVVVAAIVTAWQLS